MKQIKPSDAEQVPGGITGAPSPESLGLDPTSLGHAEPNTIDPSPIADPRPLPPKNG